MKKNFKLKYIRNRGVTSLEQRQVEERVSEALATRREARGAGQRLFWRDWGVLLRVRSARHLFLTVAARAGFASFLPLRDQLARFEFRIS